MVAVGGSGVELRADALEIRVGSMITLFFHDGPVRSWAEASASDTKRFASWHAGLLSRGIYWPPSQYEAAFLSGAHTEADIARTVKAAPNLPKRGDGWKRNNSAIPQDHS